MTSWMYYPKSRRPCDTLLQVVSVFIGASDRIDSCKHGLESNAVLSEVYEGLASIGFKVESSKRRVDKVHVPVLFGLNGQLEKSFDADAYNEKDKIVLEVEAGRAVSNYQFLKDLFQACIMSDVDYFVLAVRRKYKGRPDFDNVLRFFDTMYASQRLNLPLSGILVIGY